MISLRNKNALITGASSGIGRAIAVQLAAEDVTSLLVGTNEKRLKSTAEQVAAAGSKARCIIADLATDDGVDSVVRAADEFGQPLNLVVHAAGQIRMALLSEFSDTDLNEQFAVNVRAPMRLTRGVLPIIPEKDGQIVFVNSSIIARARPTVGVYGATKHALEGYSSSLRAEVNPRGIRVLSVFPGRTATPQQEEVYRWEQRDYDPERLLQPDDVASVVVHALRLPPTAEVTNIWIRPMFAD